MRKSAIVAREDAPDESEMSVNQDAQNAGGVVADDPVGIGPDAQMPARRVVEVSGMLVVIMRMARVLVRVMVEGPMMARMLVRVRCLSAGEEA
jgi:hypothetical protein